MAPLKQAKDMFDVLIDEKNEGQSDKNSPWYKNCLGEDYITARSTKIPDRPFVNAVLKIQRNEHTSLTTTERNTVKKLLMSADVSGDCEELEQTAEEQMRKALMRRRVASGEYENANFVLASAAEVERVWSMARYLLTTQRSRMSPKLFECMMFLKYNVGYWSVETVRDAVQILTKEMKEKAVAKANNEHGDRVEEIEEVGDEDFYYL